MNFHSAIAFDVRPMVRSSSKAAAKKKATAPAAAATKEVSPLVLREHAEITAKKRAKKEKFVTDEQIDKKIRRETQKVVNCFFVPLVDFLCLVFN